MIKRYTLSELLILRAKNKITSEFKFFYDDDVSKLEAENERLRKALTEILNSYDSIDVRIAAKALEE